MEWDVFISYASEDKIEFVKPLAKKLRDRGVKVWYDDFEIKLGDSISKSIDKGLINSNFCLLILSKKFLSKDWTDYELKSIINKEVNGKKVILPIWHNISKDELKTYSLYLADKFALSSTMDENELMLKIIEAVRPDIINSNLLIHAVRQAQKESKVEFVNISKLKYDNTPVHKELPKHLIIATKTLVQLFTDVIRMDLNEMLYVFLKDWDFTTEFIIWNVIACSYLDFIKTKNISFSDVSLKKDIFNVLLIISMNNRTSINANNYPALTQEQIEELRLIYVKHMNEVMLVIGNKQ